MRIAIIGGGASGALTALHLARALPVGSAEITVIEPAEEIGRRMVPWFEAIETNDLVDPQRHSCSRRAH